MCVCVRTGRYIGRCVGRGGVVEDLRGLLLEVRLWGTDLLVLLMQWMLLQGERRVLQRQSHLLLLQREQLLTIRGLR